MCLGIPGQLKEIVDPERQLATVDVSGVTRTISIGLLEEEGVGPGDWVLIHVGFAMSRIDERKAAETLAALRELGAAYDDEMASFSTSMVDDRQGG